MGGREGGRKGGREGESGTNRMITLTITLSY